MCYSSSLWFFLCYLASAKANPHQVAASPRKSRRLIICVRACVQYGCKSRFISVRTWLTTYLLQPTPQIRTQPWACLELTATDFCTDDADCGDGERICHEKRCMCPRNKPIEDRERSQCLSSKYRIVLHWIAAAAAAHARGSRHLSKLSKLRVSSRHTHTHTHCCRSSGTLRKSSLTASTSDGCFILFVSISALPWWRLTRFSTPRMFRFRTLNLWWVEG